MIAARGDYLSRKDRRPRRPRALALSATARQVPRCQLSALASLAPRGRLRLEPKAGPLGDPSGVPTKGLELTAGRGPANSAAATARCPRTRCSSSTTRGDLEQHSDGSARSAAAPVRGRCISDAGPLRSSRLHRLGGTPAIYRPELVPRQDACNWRWNEFRPFPGQIVGSSTGGSTSGSSGVISTSRRGVALFTLRRKRSGRE